MLIWIVIVFFSILIHELGHALTARHFGSTVDIELNAMGGLTSWSVPAEEFGPGRRALVAAAGSGVGVAFGAAVWLVAHFSGPFQGTGGYVINSLIWVNLFWGLLNWLPVRPLDGGHLLISILEKVAPRRFEKISDAIFLAAAVVALAVSLYLSLFFAALISGWLLWNEFVRRRPRRPPVGLPPMTYDDAATMTNSSEEPDQVDG